MCKVSVITAVYNCEKYISETIDSVINQEYQNWEMVLVDDFSKDNSIEMIEKYHDDRIRLYTNSRNMGVAYTKNRAIKEAKGEYIAVLDHDDINMPNRIMREVEYLDRHQDIDVVGGQFDYIDENGEYLKRNTIMYFNPKYIRAQLMLGNALGNGSTMFRRSFVEKNEILYRDNMCGAEDYMFWVECSLKGWIVNIDEIMFKFRKGDFQESHKMRTQYWKERKNAIDLIHRTALEGWGFQLSEEEYLIINKVFMEEGEIDNQDEMQRLFDALQNIAKQAQKLELENSKEIVTMCRKRFGEKVGKAFYLWK